MSTIKGIITFPKIFTAEKPKGSEIPKFGLSLLIPPNDPQIAIIQAEVDAAKLNTFPSGYTGKDECFGPYDVKYAGKDYYDPRFSGWYVFSCSAAADDKPAVVDANHQPILDPSKVYSGMVVWVNAGISGYIKGKGGVGGWLNGVMLTDEVGSMGRLDGKPSVEQMFGNITATQTPAAPAPAPAPAPAAPAPAPAPAAHMMSSIATNTYEEYIAVGWTDESLRANGLML